MHLSILLNVIPDIYRLEIEYVLKGFRCWIDEFGAVELTMDMVYNKLILAENSRKNKARSCVTTQRGNIIRRWEEKKGSLSYPLTWKRNRMEVSEERERQRETKTLFGVCRGSGRGVLRVRAAVVCRWALPPVIRMIRTRPWTARAAFVGLLVDGWLFNCHSVFVRHQWQLCSPKEEKEKKRRWKTKRKQRQREGDEKPKRSSVINQHRYAGYIYIKATSSVGRETESM